MPIDSATRCRPVPSAASVACDLIPAGKSIASFHHQMTRFLISNTLYGNPKVFAWDRKSGRPLHEFPENYEYNEKTIAVSPDARILATPQGQNVELWNIRTGKLIRRFHADKEGVYALAFSPDGKTLVSGGDDLHLRLWDVETGELKWNVGPPIAYWSTLLAFTPDGRKIVASRPPDDWISIFDASDGKRLHNLQSRSRIGGLAISPDGATLITGGGEGSIPVWSITKNSIT
jgi:WD40 repeat protein